MLQAVIWTVFAFVGGVVAIGNVIEAYQDRQAVIRSGKNGGRRLLAYSSYMADLNRAGVQAIFLILGLSAIVPAFHISGLIIVWGLVAASALIAMNSVLAFVTRRKLRVILLRDEVEMARLLTRVEVAENGIDVPIEGETEGEVHG